MSNYTSQRVLDCQGDACPMPLLKAKKAMESLESGQVLEILGTDEDSQVDLPGWCERVGHTFLGVKEEEDCFKFYIKKG